VRCGHINLDVLLPSLARSLALYFMIYGGRSSPSDRFVVAGVVVQLVAPVGPYSLLRPAHKEEAIEQAVIPPAHPMRGKPYLPSFRCGERSRQALLTTVSKADCAVTVAFR